jgi:hypothetical protein
MTKNRFPVLYLLAVFLLLALVEAQALLLISG